MVLRFQSGEEIKAGDAVLFHGEPARIEFVAADAHDTEMGWYVREFGGGVMIVGGAASRVFMPADHIAEYEDLMFVSRAK